MPRWRADADADAARPFVAYTVPALELRRLLAEARQAARAAGTRFDLDYTRLKVDDGARARGGDETEAWRAHSRGVAVRIRGDDGHGNGRCESRDESGDESRYESRDESGNVSAERIAPSGWWLQRWWPVQWWVAAEGAAAATWQPCAEDELAWQPEPSALALKLSLFYPYAIVPGASRELVCNY